MSTVQQIALKQAVRQTAETMDALQSSGESLRKIKKLQEEMKMASLGRK